MSDRYEQRIVAGRQARDDGRLEEAERDYAEAAQLAGDEQQRAHALRHVSDIASDRGDFARALVAGEQALALSRQNSGEADLNMANTVRVVARALRGSGRVDEAADAWREARRLYLAAVIADGVEECDRSLA